MRPSNNFDRIPVVCGRCHKAILVREGGDGEGRGGGEGTKMGGLEGLWVDAMAPSSGK